MNRGGLRKSLASYAFYYLTIFALFALDTVLTITVFYLTYKRSDKSLSWAIFLTILIVMVLTTVCTAIAIWAKRKLFDDPAEVILRATDRIAGGDFKVNLPLRHPWGKYDDFDLIYQNLNTMAQELSKTEILRGDFIANVSHEIKTPLAIIRNYASLLNQEDLQADKRKECLQVLNSTSEKLTTLVTNILKLNKLENQKISPEFKDFNLSEELAELILNVADSIDKKGLELECDIPDNIHVESDISLVGLIFNNLLSNAVKFTEKGGKIEISLKSEPNYVSVSVKDSGCGMTPETGEHIFEKFYQGDTSHSQEGNGLGLAMVKKAIDLLGGKISVESQLGQGSVFTFRLRK